MASQLTRKEIKKGIKTIEVIYQRYLTRLDKLKKKQTEIIEKFIKELEERRIEEIKKALK